MAIAEFEEVKKILICPQSGYPLIKKGDLLVPNNEEINKLTEIHYRFINEQPVLVDYDNSILDENYIFKRNGESVVVRKQSRLRSWIKEHLLHPDGNKITADIAQEFVNKLKSKTKKPRLLIIGGGVKGIGTDIFYNDPDIQVISFDIYASPLTQFIADAHQIPLETGSIDGVWIQYVLEHVLEPWVVTREIDRILNLDGLVYSETPFLQQVHEGAYDFVRFTHNGHRWLFRGFTEIKSGIAMGPGVQLLWTVEHCARGIFRSRALGQIVKLSLFWLRYIDKIIPIRFGVDNASSFYFFGCKANKKLCQKDMIKYYKGSL